MVQCKKSPKDDIIIIISYATLEFEEAKRSKPWIIFPNETTLFDLNHLKSILSSIYAVF
jgi:aspartate 1-decarboxylase